MTTQGLPDFAAVTDAGRKSMERVLKRTEIEAVNRTIAEAQRIIRNIADHAAFIEEIPEEPQDAYARGARDAAAALEILRRLELK